MMKIDKRARRCETVKALCEYSYVIELLTIHARRISRLDAPPSARDAWIEEAGSEIL